MQFGKFSLGLAAAVLLGTPLWAALALDPVFSSNMVLQQQRPVVFFGKADPKAAVAVEFAGKKVETTADNSGAWRAEFPAMDADFKALTATVKRGKESVELKNLLVGEVWFCSGQSNMALPVGAKYRRGSTASNCEEEVKNANYPELRFVLQSRVISNNKKMPAKYAKDTWQVCSPESIAPCSAVAYFFGRSLLQSRKVPVGLICSSWGGTKIQPWIPDDCYEGIEPEAGLVKEFKKDDAGLKAMLDKISETYTKGISAYYEKWEKLLPEKAKSLEYATPDFDDSKWKPLSGGWKPGCATLRWYRTSVTVPENTKVLKIFVPALAEEMQVYLNGALLATRKVQEYGKALTVTVPADRIKAGKNVLAFRFLHIYAAKLRSFAGLSVSADKKALRTAPLRQFDASVLCDKKIGARRPAHWAPPFMSQQFPGNLYNGMVDSWTKLPVRGVIWYQGCSNNGQAHYLELHKRLIESWRAKWHNPEMPFLIVQLAGYEPARKNAWQTADPNAISGYPLTRNIQLQMLQLPNVGLGTAIDIGEVDNIHPGNKQDLGARLALEARRIAYKEAIESEGPLFDKAVPEGKTIRVHFTHGKGLKSSDGKAIAGFAVAGADKKFVWAEAKIDGDSVVVSHPQVAEPKFVRYAYVGFRGDLNLQNGAGLPAYPFSSIPDDLSGAK